MKPLSIFVILSKLGRLPYTRTTNPLGMPCLVRFFNLHVDLVGPLPPSEGMTSLFTLIDCFTRWPETISIPDVKASTCTKALTRHWIARLGVAYLKTSLQITVRCLYPPCGVNWVTLLGFECNRLWHITPKPMG